MNKIVDKDYVVHYITFSAQVALQIANEMRDQPLDVQESTELQFKMLNEAVSNLFDGYAAMGNIVSQIVKQMPDDATFEVR